MSLGDYKEGVKKFLIGLVPGAGEYKAYQELKKYAEKRGSYPYSPAVLVANAGIRTIGLGTAALVLALNEPLGAAVISPFYIVPTYLPEAESFRDFQADEEDYNEFQNTGPDLEI